MNQKPSMKEILEKRKAHRASQFPINAKTENGSENKAANDPTIEAADDQSEIAPGVTLNDAAVQRELPPIKKKALTLKEMLNEKNASKQRRALALGGATRAREYQDSPIDNGDEEAEQRSPEDSDDAEEDEKTDGDTECYARCISEPVSRFAATTTGTAPGLKKPYPTDAFGSLAPVIKLMAGAVQVSPEMIGSTMIGLISALAQPLINVSPKKFDTGCPVTINMLVIAESGERKSSSISAVDKAIRAAINLATDCRRYMFLQDTTVDGMIVSLISRCHSMLLIAPEGASLLSGHAMKPENLGRFMGTVSSLYSGEALTRTRVDEHNYAEDRRLSVLMFVQPVIAMDFLSSPLVMQQGLGNRFMYSQPQSLLGTRAYRDIELEDAPLYKQYCEKITKLANQPWKINPLTQGVDARTVRLTDDAKDAWVEYYNAMELTVGPGGDMATHSGYATRFPEQVLRLAALLAIVDDPAVIAINEETMLRAIKLGSYYMDSAMSAFDVAPANKDELDASALLDWMRSKQQELNVAGIPVRLMYKDGPRCARPKRRTEVLLELLEARGEVSGLSTTVVYGPENKRSNQNYTVTDL